MRTQQKIWQNEHLNATALPSEMAKSSTLQPSQYVVNFHEFLQQKGVEQGKAVDIGAGKGRNSLYLAQQGFEVFSLDYIQQAVDHITSAAQAARLADKVHAVCIPIDQTWPFEDNFFDVAVDCFSSIDIETKEGREKYRSEMYRTLKPGGYAVAIVVSTEDEIEAELLQTSPGPEKNSTIWPQNQKFQKNYDEAELRDFYNNFEIISVEKISKQSHKLGKDYKATNLIVILRKK